MHVPEQLSQSQIDALLQKMSAGEMNVQEEKVKIKEYDFKSPKKFTKEQFRSLDSLHETFARMVASYFSALLRTVCELEVLQIEEQRYYEYNNALPDLSLVGVVDMKPEDKRYDEARIVLNLPMDVGFYMIDRVLGGPGTGYNFSRNYTDIEIAILSNILSSITSRLQDTWNHHLEVAATLSGVETNARLLQVFAPNDVVVVIMMNVKLGEHLESSMNVCIPAEFLEQVIDTFSLQFVHSSKRPDPEKERAKKQIILENVCESDMEIKAVFDEFPLELREIMQLQPDDVIPLGKSIDSEILVKVGGIPWCTAKLGEFKQKKAIKLQNIVSNGDEEIPWQTSVTSPETSR